jgi:hypothetical protein
MSRVKVGCWIKKGREGFACRGVRANSLSSSVARWRDTFSAGEGKSAPVVGREAKRLPYDRRVFRHCRAGISPLVFSYPTSPKIGNGKRKKKVKNKGFSS